MANLTNEITAMMRKYHSNQEITICECPFTGFLWCYVGKNGWSGHVFTKTSFISWNIVPDSIVDRGDPRLPGMFSGGWFRIVADALLAGEEVEDDLCIRALPAHVDEYIKLHNLEKM